jgi:hypothetical protein
MTGAPAFKEWQAIVGALTAGEQLLILRKGGIAEGRGGFAMRAQRFWLFPTAFHAQREKLKPAAHRFFAEGSPDTAPATVRLTAYAEVTDAMFVADWDTVQRLDPFHWWTEDTVRERFTWSRPPGLHVIVARVYRLAKPVDLKLTPGMAGCKSWIEVPVPIDRAGGQPVLDEATFAPRRAAILAAVAG